MDLIQKTFKGTDIAYFFDEEGVLWWPAQRICDLLGIDSGKDAAERLDEDERGRFKIPTAGGPQEAWCVNEYGLYSLILGSRKREARAFKRWIIHDVLPEIRRTGSYHSRPQLPPPTRPIREHAEVSMHLLSVWRTLRDTEEPLSNHEMAQRAGVAQRTARAHTKYLLEIGLLDLYETFPRRFYVVAARAEKRQQGYWQRLEQIDAIMTARNHLNGL